jgi:hypothetical protein
MIYLAFLPGCVKKIFQINTFQKNVIKIVPNVLTGLKQQLKNQVI